MPYPNQHMQHVTQLFGGIVGLIVLAFLAAISIYWLLFPWIVYTKLDKLIELSAEANALAKRREEYLRAAEARDVARAEAAPPTAPGYFVRVGGDTNGPFDLQKLRELKARGTIDDTTPVARGGAQEWTSAAEVLK